MTATSVPPARFDPLLVRGFFDSKLCGEILAEMRLAESGPATIHGGAKSIDERVRKTTRVRLSAETVALVKRRLLECRSRIEEHFRLRLSACEEPQFLRYQVGDFFVAHQDGNTPLLKTDPDKIRIISVVIFLNQQSVGVVSGDYGGGSLVFSGRHVDPNLRETREFAGEAGTLIAFRSETTHEVTPVTEGERHSIASWYR